MSKNESIGLFVAGIIFAIVLTVILLLKLIDTAQAIQIIISFVLVLITSIYVKRTADIAQATKEQAEEMREQRVMSTRPVIIQKAMSEIVNGETQDYFSHFEVYNAGNGPAVELEISLLNKEKSQISAHRETFLRAGESSIRGNPYLPATPFDLANLDESNYYIVCEYQGIFSRASKKQTWYQTWLPFRTSKSGRTIYVISGELEFREVPENERIDAFGSRSKPK